MKTIHSRSLLIAWAALSGALLPISHSYAADTFLNLNFSLGDPATNIPTNPRTIAGYDNVCAPFVGASADASITNIDGLGINFTINSVSSYDNGNNLEPLTASGFYTFGNEVNDHTFTLTGLTPGSTVQLYAVAAWDGNGRGGVIQFGGSTTLAQTLGDPGMSPTLANFTLINTTPLLVDLTGVVTGTLNGAGGVGSASEGQVGGFIVEITPPAAIPEPSSVALLTAGGFVALAMVRRRNRAERS